MSDAELDNLLGALATKTDSTAPPPIKPQRAVTRGGGVSAPMVVQKTAIPRVSQQGAENMDDVDAILANMNFDPNAQEASGICNKCKRQINKSDNFLEVFGKNYHLDCWTCSTCHKQLRNDDFFASRPGLTNCEKCHLATLDICAGCHKHIPGGSNISNVDGAKYHANCFVCSTCHQPLTKFTESGGRFYCEKHYQEQHNPKCVGCGKVIASQYAQADKGSYHPECFKCHRCHSTIGSGRYFVDGASFVCANCKK